VLFLPGLLNKGSGTKTPQPSFSVPSGLPTIAPSLIATLEPTIAPSVAPSVNATTPPSVAPVGSPRTYRIKPGDSLARIAKKFDTTVEEILAANPQITDPNNILVGQVILVPQSSTASPVATASP
jgi:LysM repeat protein